MRLLLPVLMELTKRVKIARMVRRWILTLRLCLVHGPLPPTISFSPDQLSSLAGLIADAVGVQLKTHLQCREPSVEVQTAGAMPDSNAALFDGVHKHLTHVTDQLVVFAARENLSELPGAIEGLHCTLKHFAKRDADAEATSLFHAIQGRMEALALDLDGKVEKLVNALRPEQAFPDAECRACDITPGMAPKIEHDDRESAADRLVDAWYTCNYCDIEAQTDDSAAAGVEAEAQTDDMASPVHVGVQTIPPDLADSCVQAAPESLFPQRGKLRWADLVADKEGDLTDQNSNTADVLPYTFSYNAAISAREKDGDKLSDSSSSQTRASCRHVNPYVFGESPTVEQNEIDSVAFSTQPTERSGTAPEKRSGKGKNHEGKVLSLESVCTAAQLDEYLQYIINDAVEVLKARNPRTHYRYTETRDRFQELVAQCAEGTQVLGIASAVLEKLELQK